MNYIHRYRDFLRDGWEVGRYYTFAGSVSYGFAKTSKLGDLRVTFGLENILDRDPRSIIRASATIRASWVAPAGASAT